MKSFVRNVAFSAAMLLVTISACISGQNQNLDVVLDQAKIVRLPERVATIVIGNPAIADGTLQSGGLLVVTGKGYGATNVLALDSRGETLAEYVVHVAGPTDDKNLIVYRGVDRETWNCAPKCEQTMVLGDSDKYFGGVTSQTSSRNGEAGKK
jgi:Flp pilus assembly secretin CpaC